MSHNAIAIAAVLLVSGFAGCAATARGQETATIAAYPSWRETDAAYRFYPGDEIEIRFLGARELDTVVKIGPDGRVSLPMLGDVMVANRTTADLRDDLVQRYAETLVDARVEIAAKSFGSRQVFVGGEVDRPGLYEIGPGVDAMQAVLLAGGFRTSARREQVLILRRGADGGSAVYGADLSARAFAGGLPALGPLERYDVVYVPRSRIAQVGLFMQQYVRDALPVQFGLYYNLAQESR